MYYVTKKPNTDDNKIYLSIAIRAYAASLDATDHRVAEFAVPGMKVEEEVAESLVGFGIVNPILEKLCPINSDLNILVRLLSPLAVLKTRI